MMPPLYKGEKIVYTLDEMKAFCDTAQMLDERFVDQTTNNFEEKILNFVQEMTRIEKWIVEFTIIRSSINLKLINQFVSLVMLIQEIGIPSNEDWSAMLAIFLKDAPKDEAAYVFLYNFILILYKVTILLS